jgi:hypothetical protein
MKATRIKNEGEQLPVTEVIGLRPGPVIQFRYNFAENVDEEGNIVFLYEYVNVKKNDRDLIISAIIRTRYSSDEVEAILRKYANKEDVLDYIQYNHFACIAKAYADGNDVTELKTRQVIEISMPFSITLSGEDYSSLADRMLKSGAHYQADVITDTVKVYVSWILPADEALLTADDRVSINYFDLYEEI